MFRTEKTVGMLKAIAMIAGLAILLWSLGLPSLRFADAANITTVSDTLSDSAPSASSTHTIVFTSPTGIANGATTTIAFPGFTVGSVDFTDIDVDDGTDRSIAATCGAADEVSASFTGTTLELVYCDGDGGSLAAGGTTTIQIGTNAAGGNVNLVNPGSEGSVEISITAGASDSGATRVAIINSVTVSAAVDTIFDFAVSGTLAGTDINGVTSNIDSTTTTIPFGTLKNGAATTTAQQLSVSTNASNGYVVTVQVDGPLQSSTGADIDYFIDGSATNTPTTWVSPTGVVGSENTYGHWGVTSDDTDTTRDAADEFGSNEFISLNTSPRVVMSHTGPANNSGVGVGTTTVGYRAEITGLQEAGDDYSAILTYVATPTF